MYVYYSLVKEVHRGFNVFHTMTFSKIAYIVFEYENSLPLYIKYK